MSERTADWSGGDSTTDAGTTAAEWPALYTQYLVRAAGQSGKSMELYQKIMDGVSRGELAATVFRDMLPAFVQARGTDYNNKLAEITTQFFSRMVQIDTAYSRDLMDSVMPGASVPPAPPLPQFDPVDPAKWFQQLTEYASQLSITALATYQALLERAAPEDWTSNRLQAVSSDYVQRRLPEHLRRLSSLYFDLLNGLNDLRAGYETEFLGGVLATAKASDRDVPVAVNLTAPVGGTASASLALTNTRDQPAFIRCGVTDIRRADGVGPAFGPQIIIAPEVLELRSGEEANFVLSLRLDEGDYDPDVLYVGAVHIARRGEPRIEVPLRITATPATPAAPAAAPARERSSAKGRK